MGTDDREEVVIVTNLRRTSTTADACRRYSNLCHYGVYVSLVHPASGAKKRRPPTVRMRLPYRVVELLARLAKPSMIVGMDLQYPAFCRANAYRAFSRELAAIDTPSGLFRAAWAIALHEHPDADVAEGEAMVENLVSTVKSRVRSTAVDAKLAHLHDVLFDLLEFRGNVEDYYSPSNSYLCDVLRTRRGLPITLTLIYRRVAQGIGLTVHGVNAPGHFLAEVEAEHGKGQSIYVDPFFGGGLLHEDEVFQRILQATGKEVSPTAEHLARAAPRQWLGRMLNNLQAVFASTGRDRDVYAMQEMQGLL